MRLLFLNTVSDLGVLSAAYQLLLLTISRRSSANVLPIHSVSHKNPLAICPA